MDGCTVHLEWTTKPHSCIVDPMQRPETEESSRHGTQPSERKIVCLSDMNMPFSTMLYNRVRSH